MAYTTDTAQTHIIIDSATKLVAKFLYWTAGTGAESNELKVNAETLAYRTFDLTVGDTANAAFQPGDKVTGQTSGAIAFVSSWDVRSNTVTVTNISGNTAFNSSETIIIDRTQKTLPLVAATAPQRDLSLASLWYSVGNGLMLEIAGSGTYANGTSYRHPSMLLSGNGYLGKNQFPVAIPNPASNATGNYSFTTHAQAGANNYSYTIIAEFHKGKGFASHSG